MSPKVNNITPNLRNAKNIPEDVKMKRYYVQQSPLTPVLCSFLTLHFENLWNFMVGSPPSKTVILRSFLLSC